MGLVDIALLVAGCLAVLYSFEREGGLRPQLLGSLPLRVRSYQNGQCPQPGEEVPAPVPWDDRGLLMSDVDGTLSLWKATRRRATLERVAVSAAAGQGLAGGLLAVSVSGARAATLSREGQVAVFDASLGLRWRARAAETTLGEGALAWWEAGVRKGDAEGALLVATRAEKTDDKGNAARLAVSALDGASGQSRWSSEKARDEAGPAALAALAGMDWAAFKLHAVAGLDTDSEQPWEDFASDVERALPHRWRTPADAQLELAAWRGAPAANVLLARHQHGFTAFHAYSGRVLTRLLLGEGPLTVDADGDGLVESFLLHLPLHYDPLSGAVSVPPPPLKCDGPVRVGLPPLHNVGAVPVCSSITELERASLSGIGPIFVRIANATRSSGGGDEKRLLAYLLSSGRVVVFNAKAKTGAPLVSLLTEASWDAQTKCMRHVSLTPFGKGGRSLIAIGDTHAVIVSVLGSGHVLASWKLDSSLPPVRAPVVADVDGDGHNDVVITTPASVLVYRVRPAPASRLTGFVVLALIALLGAGAWALSRRSM